MSLRITLPEGSIQVGSVKYVEMKVYFADIMLYMLISSVFLYIFYVRDSSDSDLIFCVCFRASLLCVLYICRVDTLYGLLYLFCFLLLCRSNSIHSHFLIWSFSNLLARID